MTNLSADDRKKAAAAPAVDAPVKKAATGLEALLKPFVEQSVRLTSVVAIGRHPLWTEGHSQAAASVAADEAVQFRLAVDKDGGLTVTARLPIPQPGRGSGGRRRHSLDSLARHVRELSKDVSADHLLLLSAGTLPEMLGPLADDFPFRAVGILSSSTSDQSAAPAPWKLQRALFDRGLIGIGVVQVDGSEARCFLASDAVQSLDHLGVGSRGHITMPSLGSNGRFANQLFQYAYVRMYALRHGLTAAVPAWQGQQLFDLHDPASAGLALRKLSFGGFTDDDRHLWDKEDPPIDIELWGYFQELPECWRRHRQFLRRLFQLPVPHARAIDAWRDEVTHGGRRTLVAVHVRRGDYRIQQRPDMPWFRIVPELWYLVWLRNIWPTLRDPVLYVATDEPDVILPIFREFETVSPTFLETTPAVPDYLGDFEILRRADYLAICNSSFSRLAAILAASTQKCFIPYHHTQAFELYEPWMDPGFWARYADAPRARKEPPRIEPARPAPARTEPAQPTPASTGQQVSISASISPTTYVDVSDLLLYLRNHTTLSGIQRVQCEILRNLLDAPRPGQIRFVVLDDTRGIGVILTSALKDLLEHVRSDAVARTAIDAKLRALTARVLPFVIRPADIVLTIGAFWSVSSVGLWMQELKNSGVIIGVFIHDIISVNYPEYFYVRDTRIFLKGLVEGLTFADFIITTSDYNKTSIIEHMAARHLPPVPVHVVPLAHELSIPALTGAKVSSLVAKIIKTEYVLCVGTIEVRKNPTYLFNIWRLMVRAGRAKVPTLVFVGRKGWLVQDFMEQLKACNYLDERIVVLHDVTDVELAQLYQKCLLTMFPSWAEGWGLPVGESLAYGKVSIASNTGAIPEVGGALVDYIDPYDASDGLAVLRKYLDDPARRRRREAEIARQFEPRPWRRVADEFLHTVQMLACEVRRFEGVAAIELPPNRFLPISSDTGAKFLDGVEGELSADLCCIAGWRPPEAWGVWADEPTATLRFRTNVPAGTRICVLLRIAPGGSCHHIRISSGSGAEIAASVGGASDTLAALSCEVEQDGLVSARLSVANPEEAKDLRAPYWGLKGILYFQPGGSKGGNGSEQLPDMNVPQQRQAKPLAPQARVELPQRPKSAATRTRILLLPAPPMDDSRRAASFVKFLQSADSYWPSGLTTFRDAPIFADQADKALFYAKQGHKVGPVTEQINLIRRTNQYVSTSRFTEGSVFDRFGVSKAFGYIQGSPPVEWLSKNADGIWTGEATFASAPSYDKSYAIFYNGNLHNYYHWMVEGMVSLHIISGAIGADSKLNILLPKSMDIDAVFDHRDSIRAVGFDACNVEEVSADLVRVREAIWVDSDQIDSLPGSSLKAFQRRVAARYADAGGRRKRRLLVARKGPTRKVSNLDQVQAFLAKHDFETVYLEGMSVADQIILFQSAEFVVGPHGAGMANLLFCEPGTKIIEFAPSADPRPFFWLIAEKLDCVYGMQLCAGASSEGFQADIAVDINKLQALYRMLEAHS